MWLVAKGRLISLLSTSMSRLTAAVAGKQRRRSCACESASASPQKADTSGTSKQASLACQLRPTGFPKVLRSTDIIYPRLSARAADAGSVTSSSCWMRQVGSVKVVAFDRTGEGHAGNDQHFRSYEHDEGDAAAEARPGARRADQQDLARGSMGAERWQYPALAVFGGQEPRDQEEGAGLLQAAVRR